MSDWVHSPGSLLGQSHKSPRLMGILNVTPDSFYDGGRYERLDDAVERAREMSETGADIIDIGGESTRPGADPVPESEELDRVVPVVKRLSDELSTPISVDTTKSTVAHQALEAGAEWINDVTALEGDPEMAEVIAEHDASVVLMHMQGTPRTMQDNPQYRDVVQDISEFLRQRIEYAKSAGISEEKLIIDPGIGFGKTLEHNRQIIEDIGHFRNLEVPVLVGHSRKSFLGEVLNETTENRLYGTLSISAHLLRNNVDVIRVHDIKPHYDLRKIYHWLHTNGDVQ